MAEIIVRPCVPAEVTVKMKLYCGCCCCWEKDFTEISRLLGISKAHSMTTGPTDLPCTLDRTKRTRRAGVEIWRSRILSSLSSSSSSSYCDSAASCRPLNLKIPLFVVVRLCLQNSCCCRCQAALPRFWFFSDYFAFKGNFYVRLGATRARARLGRGGIAKFVLLWPETGIQSRPSS